MADINLAPRVRCDNCGLTTDKVRPRFDTTSKWERPSDWGDVRVAPTLRGTYPNNIAMTDLCPRCLAMVHEAVGKSLELARQPAAPSTGAQDSAPQAET
jgi:hypothetical protein